MLSAPFYSRSMQKERQREATHRRSRRRYRSLPSLLVLVLRDLLFPLPLGRVHLNHKILHRRAVQINHFSGQEGAAAVVQSSLEIECGPSSSFGPVLDRSLLRRLLRYHGSRLCCQRSIRVEVLGLSERLCGLVDEVVPRGPRVNELVVRQELIRNRRSIGGIERSEEVFRECGSVGGCWRTGRVFAGERGVGGGRSRRGFAEGREETEIRDSLAREGRSRSRIRGESRQSRFGCLVRRPQSEVSRNTVRQRFVLTDHPRIVRFRLVFLHVV